MTFWTQPDVSPTRQFRFKVTNGTDWWWVSSCSKPSYEVSSEEYKLINHKFKYPGVATWNDVNLTIVDVGKTAKGLYEALFSGGWNPKNINNSPDGLSKRKMSNALNTMQEGNSVSQSASDFIIQQLNAEGNAVETWTLINPFIKSTNFGQLDYSSDELVKLELVISYDYATLSNLNVVTDSGTIDL